MIESPASFDLPIAPLDAIEPDDAPTKTYAQLLEEGLPHKGGLLQLAQAEREGGASNALYSCWFRPAVGAAVDGARSRTRTGTPLRATNFKSDASTYFAIRAGGEVYPTAPSPAECR